MTNILETVEVFTQRSQDEPHSHITTDEARAFYLSSTEGFIGPQPLLHEAETIILGCTACSEVFTEVQPTRHTGGNRSAAKLI